MEAAKQIGIERIAEVIRDSIKREINAIGRYWDLNRISPITCIFFRIGSYRPLKFTGERNRVTEC
jgi:hypothetical protein